MLMWWAEARPGRMRKESAAINRRDAKGAEKKIKKSFLSLRSLRLCGGNL
jgi:hypothetical protein